MLVTCIAELRSVGYVVAYRYTLDDDSERPMDYETSLLPRVWSLMYHYNHIRVNVIKPTFIGTKTLWQWTVFYFIFVFPLFTKY